MKKIGLLCLALVLALGTLGVAYAMWWDEVTIEGTVNTGSVEISIEDVSATYVYKNTTSGEIVMSGVPLVGNDLMYVASATAEDVSVAGGPKKVQMTFDNIFPTMEPIAADVLLHYTGSVPAHVVLLEDDVDPSIAPYLVQTWWMLNATEEWEETEIDGIQLHYCDLVYLWVHLDPELLQDAGKDAQGISGNFTKTVIVHQWNEAWPPEP